MQEHACPHVTVGGSTASPVHVAEHRFEPHWTVAPWQLGSNSEVQVSAHGPVEQTMVAFWHDSPNPADMPHVTSQAYVLGH